MREETNEREEKEKSFTFWLQKKKEIKLGKTWLVTLYIFNLVLGRSWGAAAVVLLSARLWM